MGLVGTYAEIMRGVGASKRVFEILDREPLIPCRGGKTLEKINGLIEFDNVNFCYPTRVEDKVFPFSFFFFSVRGTMDFSPLH